MGYTTAPVLAARRRRDDDDDDDNLLRCCRVVKRYTETMGMVPRRSTAAGQEAKGLLGKERPLAVRRTHLPVVVVVGAVEFLGQQAYLRRIKRTGHNFERQLLHGVGLPAGSPIE